jgi:hypothetical protein
MMILCISKRTKSIAMTIYVSAKDVLALYMTFSGLYMIFQDKYMCINIQYMEIKALRW